MFQFLKNLFKKDIFVLSKETTVGIDIDDTLVLWQKPTKKDKHEFINFTCPYTKTIHNLKPHKGHIELLKKYKKRNLGVIVWSAGGAMWAKEVVIKLNLEKYVDLIITKPSRYVDDLEISEWAGNRVYIKE